MKAIWYDDAIYKDIKITENQAMEEVCAAITDKVKKSMKPGRYRPWRSKRPEGGIHWSSTPGTPPAPDTEELKDSISYATSAGNKGGIGPNSRVPNIEAPTAAPNDIKGRIGTSEIKAFWHELGTSRTDLDKRPFLRPALEKSTSLILKIFGKYKI